MKKRHKNIMVWLIIWAGLLIGVLYSPVGSPDLYSSHTIFVNNQPVTINNGTIPKAPKIKSGLDNNDNELTIPDVSSELTSNHAAGNYMSGSTSSGGSTYGNMHTQLYQNSNSGSGGMGVGGSFFASSSSRSSSTGSSGITLTNGITAISTTTDGNNNNNTSKQSVGNQITDTPGGTDPGGDPTGNPIPVGEGWGLFILLGMCYSAFKIRFHIQKEFILKLFGKKE